MEEVKEKKVTIFDTPELGLAAFLHMNKVEIVSVNKAEMKDKNGKKFGTRYAFWFNNNDGRCAELELKWANEPIGNLREYDSSVRLLKMMIKSKKYNNIEEIYK